MERMEDNGNDRLAGLFSEYRAAMPDPAGSPEFMPQLWRKIEARRAETTSVFRRLTQVCVAATAAVVILLAAFPTAAPDNDLYSSNFADVVSADHTDTDMVQVLPAGVLGDAR